MLLYAAACTCSRYVCQAERHTCETEARSTAETLHLFAHLACVCVLPRLQLDARERVGGHRNKVHNFVIFVLEQHAHADASGAVRRPGVHERRGRRRRVAYFHCFRRGGVEDGAGGVGNGEGGAKHAAADVDVAGGLGGHGIDQGRRGAEGCLVRRRHAATAPHAVPAHTSHPMSTLGRYPCVCVCQLHHAVMLVKLSRRDALGNA